MLSRYMVKSLGALLHQFATSGQRGAQAGSKQGNAVAGQFPQCAPGFGEQTGLIAAGGVDAASV